MTDEWQKWDLLNTEMSWAWSYLQFLFYFILFLQNYDGTIQEDERLVCALIQNEMEVLTIFTLIFIKVEP